MDFASGRSLCRSSSRLAATSTLKYATPVKLTPGRLKLLTRPSSTGSEPIMNRIGIVDVASLAAAASAMPPAAADRDASLNELGSEPQEAVVLLIGRAIVDDKIAVLDQALISQSVHKSYGGTGAGAGAQMLIQPMTGRLD